MGRQGLSRSGTGETYGTNERGGEQGGERQRTVTRATQINAETVTVLANSRELPPLYHTPGHEAVLSCLTVSSCSNIYWFYSRDGTPAKNTVRNGRVVENSVRAARLSLTTNCSLLINNITAEDAGQYVCRQGDKTKIDVVTYLNVLMISASPADPSRDAEVTLTCSLERPKELRPCGRDSIRWLDETGSVLLGDGVGYKFLRQTNCVSVLRVKHQNHYRRFSCQFIDERNNLKIEGFYTSGFEDPSHGRKWKDVVENSVRAARLSLTTNCSLLINNITAEDAGQYLCRLGEDNNRDVVTYLNVLMISASPADPSRDAEVTLTCSLEGHKELRPCGRDSIRWLDETGSVLLGDGVGYKFLRQTNCVSVLRVKHQNHYRRFSCQFIDERNNLKIEAFYTSGFEANSRKLPPLYHRPGYEAVLSCFPVSSCSNINWFYSRDGTQTRHMVVNGKVVENSVRAARLSLTTNCSLLINNITAEDAGQYLCRLGEDNNRDVVTYLNVLMISASPADPSRDAEVTLTCSLERPKELRPCGRDSIRWLDETGSVLLGDGVGYKFLRQTNCVSVLRVKHQNHYRRFSCQFIDERNNLKIEAFYTSGFEANGVELPPLYRRPGHEAVLSCFPVSSCSNINWFYSRDGTQTRHMVVNGDVVENSVRSAKLSLTTNCSLLINNITAEDAGQYFCRLGEDNNRDVVTYLNVLMISASPPDPSRDAEVTLTCSLERYKDLRPCGWDSIRWVDETGSVLLGDGVGYKFLRQTNCVSVLRVKHQNHYRRFSCQFIDERKNLKIEGFYTSGFEDDKTTIIVGAVVGGVVGVVLIIVITVVLIKHRKKTKVTEDVHQPAPTPDELEPNLTYVTITHDSPKASSDQTD
ncbi:hypothetical protein Q5P01_004624 [Channa striata]|uniref:Ig-like domain-containing protein n=1 Tax=Channa striata TaxID=64152 RepID=A0AA88NC65_CHASR|nr:hypothetical protein Q5P01_004624 [Channa striata]